MSWTIWLGAGLLGAAVGVAELLSRYRDSKIVWQSTAAFLYMSLNGGASVVALYFFRKQFPLVDEVTAAVVSGVGAMAIFRTSLFVIRIGKSDVPIGPGGFLQLLLAAADRAVDRLQGTFRSRAAAEIMAGVSFLRAHEVLPVSCLSLVQGIPDSEQEALGQEIHGLLTNLSVPDRAKAYNLGVLLIHSVGEDVLRAAVAALGDSIRVRAPREQPNQLDSLARQGHFDAQIAPSVK